jgi:acyl-CoA reductase-like NAD-dependent aldehyde dehydrogenase
MTEDRIGVRKTLKLFIGGAFPRSESGRSYAVTTDQGAFLANASQASRKDARDAVLAARAAVPPWTKATAYNRGQILYRIAEVMESRRSQFVDEVGEAEGAAAATAQVDAAIDRVVWYAGWADKFAQVLGSSNPVAGPYFDFSLPEPTGVVAAIAPTHSSLLGLVSVVAPIIVTGNTVIVIASQAYPAPAIAWAEVLATSDLPAGVVNILTGDPGEIAPWLASHADVNALDLSGIDAQDLVRDLQIAAADTVKRVHRWPMQPSDLQAPPGIDRLSAFVETKTVWHPMGV